MPNEDDKKRYEEFKKSKDEQDYESYKKVEEYKKEQEDKKVKEVVSLTPKPATPSSGGVYPPSATVEPFTAEEIALHTPVQRLGVKDSENKLKEAKENLKVVKEDKDSPKEVKESNVRIAEEKIKRAEDNLAKAKKEKEDVEKANKEEAKAGYPHSQANINRPDDLGNIHPEHVSYPTEARNPDGSLKNPDMASSRPSEVRTGDVNLVAPVIKRNPDGTTEEL